MFTNMFTSIADTGIPHYEVTIRHNVCDRYWKQYQQTNLDEYHDKLKEIRNEVVYAIRDSKRIIKKKKNDLYSKTEVSSKMVVTL